MKTSSHWEKIGLYPHHGISFPLSSLHSERSYGIGEFLDLIPLFQWCKDVGFDCLHLLPLNDTGDDLSFFNPVSSCALDPIYLSLHALGICPDPADFAACNRSPSLLRFEVKKQKMKWLFRHFEKTFSSLQSLSAYQSFISANPWVKTYAAFKAWKEAFGEKPWNEWDQAAQTKSPNQKIVNFHIFLQYHCFSQMAQVKSKASALGVFLKGDMPILLSPDSADVWSHRSLFQTDLLAGAPPDLYNPLGQKWGFPLYNWEAMRATQFAWWKTRFKVLENLYHLYRIDHVVGFFRIWGIPPEKTAMEGAFFPTDPHLWRAQGKEILEMMLTHCSLLPIAEDLGTIPPEVDPVLKELGICSTKMLRWQKREGQFIPYDHYEPLSMTSVSNADLDPLPLWWKKFPEEAASFARFKGWDYSPILRCEQQLEILRDAHHTSSYFHINPLQEYLLAFKELSHPNLEDERINIPGTLLSTNWTYRFRPSLEELISHSGLRQAIEKLLI